MVGRAWLLVAAMLLVTFGVATHSLADPETGEPPRFGVFEDLEASNVVINGMQAAANSPFLQSTVRILGYTSSGAQISTCSGIIVARDLILTAGHCFQQDGMTAQILFGSGENQTYTHLLTALGYKGTFPRNNRNIATTGVQRSKAWNSQTSKRKWLSYDPTSRADFLQKIRAQQTWANAFGGADPGGREFFDFALVKIEAIPEGYRPVRFFNGVPHFKETVFVAGYGLNHRQLSKNQYSLRFARQYLIGHYTRRGRVSRGWQFYGVNASMCLGDSGGPVFIYRDGDYQLLGMSVFLYNACANSGWAMSPTAFKTSLEATAKALRSEWRL